LTYSIHQDKRPVRAIGNMNAKDYVFGQRTIAGTLIFAVFNKHWAYEIMDEYRTAGEHGSAHFLVDELPPFQITISAANEYGFAARLALYGIRVVNEGQVMSTNDVYTENTYQFVATDLDYLTACTGYKKPKAIRVPPIPIMNSTPLPAKRSAPAAPTTEVPAEVNPPNPEEPMSVDPPKPDTITTVPAPAVPVKMYGDMTEQQVMDKFEIERKVDVAEIDKKSAAGEYKNPSEENRIRVAHNAAYSAKVEAAKKYFDDQRRK
jgi:hypothetical protein